MIILVLGEENQKAGKTILDALITEFPQLKSVFLVINTKQNDSLHDLDMNLYHGSDHILESMEDLKFRIGPKSFFQTNGLQALELYKVARDFADLKGTETVYDLYTGTGTIALFVAKKAAKVIGIEYVEPAIIDAKINAEFNGVNHAHFFAGDMKDVFSPELIAQEGRPDIVITDPPRAGMHQNVIDRLNELKPEKIVYVSCNPATQARDLNLLSENFEVAKIRPVDMFPHTHHVENVVLLKLKK
jgi:23S rRNA (uracil1939-C5)-methyltransferase